MSANPVKGETEFVAGDKTYTLRFTFEAMIEIEERFGLRIDEAFPNIMTRKGPVLANLRFTLWKGLQANHPELSERDVGEIILSAMQGHTLADALMKAVHAAMPPPPDGPPDPPQPSLGTGPH